jgi:hypothetical protein
LGEHGSPSTANNLSATQIQSVNNLAAGSDSINTVATSGSTLTTGSAVSGTYASTAALDGVYWQIADTAGTLDMYFEFNVGSTGVPTTAVWTGGLTTAVDTLKVYAYNWAGSSWDQVGTLNGTTSLVINNAQYDFTTAHVGTGGNIGLVRLRFQNTGLVSANFYTDQVLCGYTNVQTFPSNFSSLGISAGGKINGVVLTDTLTTYTGDTPQTGDSFARIGATGSGLTSLAPASTALSNADYTARARAAKLDDLDAAISTRLAAASYTTPPTTGQIFSAVFTSVLTEAYAALNAVPTAAQLLFELRALLVENIVVGTTVTTKKIDGVTTAHTYTINNPVTPTSITTAS